MCDLGWAAGVRATTDRNHPPWPGLIATTFRSYLITGGPGKEHGTNKLPPTGRSQERSKGGRTTLCGTYHYVPLFTFGETGSERLSNWPKVTQ